MPKQRCNTLVVDGNSLFKNSFEATYNQQWSHPDIHGIYTFLMRVRNQLYTGNHNRLRVTFDGNSHGILRRLIYSDYKKSRKQPTNPTPEYLKKKESFNLQKLKLQEYLSYFSFWYEDPKVEADDVIAYYVFNKEPKEKITIMTGDVDIMQLISKDVQIFYINKSFKTKTKAVVSYEKTPKHRRKSLIITHKNFKKIFGYPVENITTIKTICGDSSDDIKNIYRVGEKSLLTQIPQLTKKHMTIPEILKECENGLKVSGIPKKRENVLRHIVDRRTEGVQGKKILKINERLVDLKNQEFISSRCIANIERNGFLSHDKFPANNSHEMMKKMQEDGIYENIKINYINLKTFFKPFTKTLA